MLVQSNSPIVASCRKPYKLFGDSSAVWKSTYRVYAAVTAVAELALAVCPGLRGEGADKKQSEGHETDHDE